MIVTVAFLMFEANSMFDYGYTFFVLVTIITAIGVYLIFIWQSENELGFIENCEEFVEKSK